MHGQVSFDLKIQSTSTSRIPAISAASLYGRGVFTTLVVERGKPFLWEKHWLRLTENAAKLEIDLSFYNSSSVSNALDELLLANASTNCRARITFFDGSSHGLWNDGQQGTTHLLITTGERREISQPLRLTLSPYRLFSAAPLANVKSCNYLENLLCLDEARKRGFDEAIRVNEQDEIVSAAMANVFWVKDGKTFTPSISCGGLAGTTRGFLLENFEVEEVRAQFASLDNADEVFLTSSGLGICPATMNAKANRSSDVAEKLSAFLNEFRTG